VERLNLLHDAIALDELHRAVKAAPVHPSWYASSAAAGRATIRVFGRTRGAQQATVGTVARVRSTQQATVATVARVR
jgi:hypothetical protein